MALDWFLPYLQNDLKNFCFVHAMPTNQPIPQKDPEGWGRCFWACFSYFISISISLRLCSALCNCGVLLLERSRHERSWGAELYEANTGLKHVKIDPKPRKNCDGDHLGTDSPSLPTCLQLHCDGLHDLQAVLVKRVERLVPHDVGLQDVAAAAAEHEKRLVQLHRLVCGGQSRSEPRGSSRRSLSPGKPPAESPQPWVEGFCTKHPRDIPIKVGTEVGELIQITSNHGTGGSATRNVNFLGGVLW